MTSQINDAALDILFREARTHKVWKEEAVSDETLRQLYDLQKWAPTSSNCSPARFIFCRTSEAKARLAQHAGEGNRAKILSSPVCVIIGYDNQYYTDLPRLYPLPHIAHVVEIYQKTPGLSEQTAFRNSAMQGAYLILAARSLGLDCGPMSGFDNAKVDAEFFADTHFQSNFICSLGHGDNAALSPRMPRRPFDEVCDLI